MTVRTNHPKLVAKHHRYADGISYNKNRYDILMDVSETAEPFYRTVGGALMLKDKAIAFIGGTSLSHRARDIVAHADVFVWGKDLRDALSKIKPHVESLTADKAPAKSSAAAAMKIVEVWTRGYAAADGRARLTIADHVDPAVAVRKAFGGLATVASVRPVMPVMPPVSEAYARMMSQHDNS